MLCVSVKSQRSVKHIWFLPTHIANAQKTKRACPYPPLKKNDITSKVYIFAPDAN